MSIQMQFNASSVAPSSGVGDPVPNGWYVLMLEKDEKKAISENKGELLSQTWTIVDGPHKGRKIFHNLNLWHVDETTAKSAWAEFSAQCYGMGIPGISQSTAEMCNHPILARVTLKAATAQYEASNRVRKWVNVNSPEGQEAIRQQAAGAGAAAPFTPPAPATFTPPPVAAPASAAFPPAMPPAMPAAAPVYPGVPGAPAAPVAGFPAGAVPAPGGFPAPAAPAAAPSSGFPAPVGGMPAPAAGGFDPNAGQVPGGVAAWQAPGALPPGIAPAAAIPYVGAAPAPAAAPVAGAAPAATPVPAAPLPWANNGQPQ